MKKKYLIIGIVFIMIITLGFSLAYWSATIVGKGSDIVVETDQLKIIFTDTSAITDKTVTPGWTTTKTFTVENKSDDVFYYNIGIENLVNTFELDYLKYKITATSETGYKMTDYEVVPKTGENSKVTLAEDIRIAKSEKQEYTIEFIYESVDEDQSDDMGKKFSGNLMIEEGKTKTLADFFASKYPEATKRQHFDKIVGSNDGTEGYDSSGVYYEDGKYTENGEKVYYWSGNVNNTKYDNWVKFANLWWRIIRTNEDGSLRLLYVGTSPSTTTGYINGQAYAYNSSYNNVVYVGYMYGTTNTLEKNRENTTAGPIKGIIDSWYETNIIKQNDGSSNNNTYDDYVSRIAIYCSDRASDKYDPSNTPFAAYQRLVDNKRPSYKCGVNPEGNLYNDSSDEEERKKDMFTAPNEKHIGNEKLVKYESNRTTPTQISTPVALITADEAAYAGGIWDTTSLKTYYYLNSNNQSVTGTYFWWTMSPLGMIEAGRDRIVTVNYTGYWGAISNAYIYEYNVIRPVLSIKACAEISGNGEPTEEGAYKFTISETCAQADN